MRERGEGTGERAPPKSMATRSSPCLSKHNSQHISGVHGKIRPHDIILTTTAPRRRAAHPHQTPHSSRPDRY